MNSYHQFCFYHQMHRTEKCPASGSNKCVYTKRGLLWQNDRQMVESQGLDLFNSMFAGEAVFNSVSLFHSCQTFIQTQTKLQPHDLHLHYYTLQLFPSYCYVCNSVCVCVCVCPGKTETSLSLSALSDAAACALDVLTQRMKLWGREQRR